MEWNLTGNMLPWVIYAKQLLGFLFIISMNLVGFFLFFKLKKVWKSVLRGLPVLTYLLLACSLQRESVHLNNKFMSVDFLPSKSDCQVCVVRARPISTRQLWKSRKNSRSRRAISSYLPTTFSCFQGQWNRLGAWFNAEHLNLYRTLRDYDALLEINCK